MNTPLPRARLAEIEASIAEGMWSDELDAALRNAAPQLIACAKLVADIAARSCRCNDIATGDFGDRCDACRARALVTG